MICEIVCWFFVIVIMILCVFFINCVGNVLLECFYGLLVEECFYWWLFLVKLIVENFKIVCDDEVFVVFYKFVFIVYIVIGDICIFVVGKEVYDEFVFMEVLNVVMFSVKEVCWKDLSECLFLEKYGKVCLCLDEIIL